MKRYLVTVEWRTGAGQERTSTCEQTAATWEEAVMHGLLATCPLVDEAQGTIQQTGVRYLGEAPVVTYQARCSQHGYVGSAGTWGHAATAGAVHGSTCSGGTEVLGVCPNCQQARWPARYGHRDCLNDCAARGLAPMPGPGTLNL